MKKIFIPLFVIAALSITSCRKERTCTCTKTTTTSGAATTTTDVDSWGHDTKREATAQCLSKKYTVTYTYNGTTITSDVVEDCKLK